MSGWKSARDVREETQLLIQWVARREKKARDRKDPRREAQYAYVRMHLTASSESREVTAVE